MKSSIVITVLLSIIVTGCSTIEQFYLLRSYENPTANSSPVDTTTTDVTAKIDSRGRQATLLSAFYGLDNDLPPLANMSIGEGAGGADGLPAIFSHEIDANTMQAGDFRIIRESGNIGAIEWVTLAPADDKGELRTILMAGHYGSIDDQPIRLEVIGNLLSLDGTVNFKGASVAVTPLENGPHMVWAEHVPVEDWDIGKEATPLPWGGSSGVPKGTKQVVRVTWAGGVTKPGGKEVGDLERLQYRVTVLLDDGSKIEAIPFALADLGDGDNNHELCLDMTGTAISVYFPSSYLTDPRDDPNPETSITISK